MANRRYKGDVSVLGDVNRTNQAPALNCSYLLVNVLGQ